MTAPEHATTGERSPARPDADAGNVPGIGDTPEASISVLKALAHPVRLRMVRMLAGEGGELCVCHFEEAFDLTQPTISHHLKRLRDAGLLDSRREGTWVHHRIRPEALAGLAATLDEWSRAAAAMEGCC